MLRRRLDRDRRREQGERTISSNDNSADLLFVDGAVYTVDAARSWAEAVAVRHGRIVAVGSNDAVAELRGSSTEVVDLGGRMLVPGFQDAHVHPVNGGLDTLRCDLSGDHGLDAYLERIRAYVSSHPDVPWILGGGWSVDVFQGGTPGQRRSTRSSPTVPRSCPIAMGMARG